TCEFGRLLNSPMNRAFPAELALTLTNMDHLPVRASLSRPRWTPLLQATTRSDQGTIGPRDNALKDMVSSGIARRGRSQVRHARRGPNVACTFVIVQSSAIVARTPARFPIVMIARISGLIVWLVTLILPVGALAEEARVRSILLMDQSDLRGTFYHDVYRSL